MIRSYRDDVRKQWEEEADQMRHKLWQQLSEEMKATGKDWRTIVKESMASGPSGEGFRLDDVETAKARERRPKIEMDVMLDDLRTIYNEVGALLRDNQNTIR
jgi:hypothetical protein